MGLTFPLVHFHSYAGMHQRNSCTVTCVEGAGHVVGNKGGVGWLVVACRGMEVRHVIREGGKA
jgi:hypothetical protein